MKIITLFNHKGGVCKTTTTYHLGWKLSQKGKKVLLVDADSQHYKSNFPTSIYALCFHSDTL